MSSGNNSNAQGNIFLTTENLAFSMPLLVVCGTYAYFKLLPVKYAVPALVVVALILQIKSQMKTLREKKIENMDDTDIDDLASELEGDDDTAAKKKTAEQLKLRKRKARLADRLAAEQRKEEKAAKSTQSKKKNKKDYDGDDDDDDVAIFAKGSRSKTKQK